MLPLSGLRVIDIGTVLVAPYASQWLADLGADVIKVEPPGGDQTRFTGPEAEPGMASLFLGLNRNKRSIVLDIASQPGREVLEQLIAGADVFMHNIRSQKLGKLEIDAATLCERYPRLVYAQVQGFASDGQYAGRPAYDDIVQGMSGIVDMMYRQSGTMRFAPMALADKTCGLVMAMAILAALTSRARTGAGTVVEVPMFETMVSFNMVENFGDAYAREDQPEMGYRRTLSHARGPYRTRDGTICFMPYTDRQWRAFFSHIGRAELIGDSRFANMTGRSSNIDLLYEMLAETLQTGTTAEWLAFAESADIAAAPVQTLEAVLKDRHLEECGYFAETDDAALGRLRYPGVPVSFAGTRPSVRQPPRMGEHTEEILAELGIPAAMARELSGDAIDGHGPVPARPVPETVPQPGRRQSRNRMR
ncbi:MAG: CoA transferase [Novosphingobium sp.]|nr:CoA transferase [Novosphingobium sp.]